MKKTIYPPITEKYFESICKEWANVIKAKESGTWIFPTLLAPYRRVWQFQNDILLQKKLFGEKYLLYLHIHLDFEQKETIDRNSLYEMIKFNLVNKLRPVRFTNESAIYIIDYLIKERNYNINFYVTGIDASIKANNWNIIRELSYLAQRNWETHVLLCTETDLTDPKILPNFSKQTTLAQNISYVPLYSKEDTDLFIDYLSYRWHTHLNNEQKQWIYDNCGGHFLLTKDVVRQVRKNPLIKNEELEHSPSLKLRGRAIFENFLIDQRNVISYVLKNKKVDDSLSHAKNLLIKQGWLRENKSSLLFTIPYLAKFFLLKETKEENKLYSSLLTFTIQEMKVFELLKTDIGKIIDRNMIAEVMWEEQWDEQYSDWAIDQIIHRIRTKIKSTKAPYELRTKKGSGFILLQK